MANPLASLWDDLPATPKAQPKPVPKARPKPDHTEAKAIYAKYLEKKAMLMVQQEYARRVAKATDGPSRTPVRPLATMGCNGGPLLCDHCLKPIILESAPYYNVPVDQAWASAPDSLKATNWVSYIKGGMIVYIAENGTLRIYHGYSRPGDCDKVGIDAITTASDAFVRDTSKCQIIWKFLEDELLPKATHDERNVVFADIMSIMYSYDPGIGVNHP